MAKHFLSKTTYVKGLQCPKAAYLSKHHPKFRDPIPPERLQRFQVGHAIGKVAQQLFPGGIDACEGMPVRPSSNLSKTKALIESGCNVLYEACFVELGVLIYVDILVRSHEGWNAYEVKSNHQVKSVYLDDAALQYAVLKASPIKLNSFSLVLLQRELASFDDETEVKQQFYINDITSACESSLAATQTKIKELSAVIAYPKIPEIRTGEQCQHPYTCEFLGFCNSRENPPSIGLFADLS